MNARTGIEPVRPELSGLRLRRAAAPRRVSRILIQIAYRWHPSGEYRRRQVDIRLMNQWLRHKPQRLSVPPPVLAYDEDNEVAPTRLQPLGNSAVENGSLKELSRDLSDLEAVERLRRPSIIRPRLTGPDPQYLMTYRPLLPRHYRDFLRHSPYPRVALCTVATMVAVSGFLWLSHLQQAEAVAAGRARVAGQTLGAQLDAARAYGLNSRDVDRLVERAHELRLQQGPVGLVVPGTHLSFYLRQERAYRALLRELHLLRHRAMKTWTAREREVQGALSVAVRRAAHLGLRRKVVFPACAIPACYRAAVQRQKRSLAWLRGTIRTLRAYASRVSSSAAPPTAAGSEIQEVHNLVAVVPRPHPPVGVDRLDSLYAAAAGPRSYARVGALGYLDREVLTAQLRRTLPSRAILISAERGRLTCYNRGKVAQTTAVTVSSSTPTGVFRIQEKRASLAVLYWNRSGLYPRYRSGSLPDWMPFSAGAALQAAPWRTAFGPGTDDAVTPFAPSTPGSVDLPTGPANRVFGWAKVGTEVVVY